MLWLSSAFLLAGAAICLVAALGVLRLPDFFMRMHAATEAGVAGCGLVLIGVGFAYPSLDIWVKVALGVGFLLLTTPIAGHLLARAGYVAGVPLWDGTSGDELAGILKRGAFDGPAARPAPRGDSVAGELERLRIVVALSAGPDGPAAAAQAIELARERRAELLALAIIDTKQLTRVGSVPLGGNYYAARLRAGRIEDARRRLAASVEHFEVAASRAGIPYALKLDEGDPVELLRRHVPRRGLLLIDGHGWFDHGAGEGVVDPLGHLVGRGVYPLASVYAVPDAVKRVVFLHDGTPHSDRTLDWLLANDLWPGAELVLRATDNATEPELGDAFSKVEALGRTLATSIEDKLKPIRADVIVHGNQGHPGWINLARSATTFERAAPIVIFG